MAMTEGSLLVSKSEEFALGVIKLKKKISNK